MTEGSLVMVHEVWGGFFFAGPADNLESEAGKQVTAMRALSSTYAGIVEKATGTKLADVRSAMKDETWYSAKEALDAGYAGSMAEATPDRDPEAEARLNEQARGALSPIFA